MSVPDGYRIVNQLGRTVTVGAAIRSVPDDLLTCSTGVQYAALIEVLSNAILYTIDDPAGSPDHNAKRASVGDLIFVDPARNFRARRDGTDACVHFQAFEN